jgi:cyanoexosortase B
MTTSSPSLPFLKDPNLFAWILGGALLILYGPLIVSWYDGWLNKSISLEHEYFSHGVLGLPLALKIVWEQRDRWQSLNDRWHPVGAVLMGFAAKGEKGSNFRYFPYSYSSLQPQQKSPI